MPYINLKHSPNGHMHVHLVWSTKNRIPFLNSAKLRTNVWHHIQEKAKEKGIQILAINGYQDHCHCMILLRKDDSLSRIIQLIKGESAYWINKENLCKGHFGWQDGYYAVSVEKEHLRSVFNYINSQEEHHRKITFKELIDQLGLKPREE